MHEDGDDTRDRASEGPTDPHQSTTDTSKINNNMGNSNGYGIGSSTIVAAEANCKLGTGLPLERTRKGQLDKKKKSQWITFLLVF